MSASLTDLEKDIEASRARLDERIDQIQDRLTTSGLVEEMLGSARRTPLNSFYDSALVAVRANPVPVLLIAAGVGLLLRGMGKSKGRLPAAVPLPRSRAPVPTDTGAPAPLPASGVAAQPEIK